MSNVSVSIDRDFIRLDGAIYNREEAEFAIKALTAAMEFSFPKEVKYSLVLRDCGQKKINVIKEIRSICNNELIQAKNMCETPGSILFVGNWDDCQRFAKVFRGYGAEVEIVPEEMRS